MKKKITSNYESACLKWQEVFVKMDKQKLMEILPEIKIEGDYLTIYHFGRKFGVHKQTGEIIAMEDDLPISVSEKFNIYLLFYYVKPYAKIRGEWVTFEKLKNTSQFKPAFIKSVLEPFANTFAGHMDKLKDACEKIGGKRIKASDMGYEIKAFECIPIQFLFWDEDDEFEARASMLFDLGSTDFIHEESIVTIASVGVERLAQIAGLDKGSNTFDMK
ncbi:DUF3786 domain-containing protein [Intestinibacter bartlettii]|uniref:DUF3786 domain-containing protein n=1 Tax=Intestinibacter bartlettii TaxID=261299 RepID=A0ABS6DUJ4_9FIRM|nr:DUF3786 domain-containing protein [Intestinibacter bartlettii]MBU5335118.1 DUF3786 domain-containing protein [Intestinibacter bartlettii]MDO5010375.1 DUF3786 domain-containing protein [Intestinibacter bartlettii]